MAKQEAPVSTPPSSAPSTTTPAPSQASTAQPPAPPADKSPKNQKGKSSETPTEDDNINFFGSSESENKVGQATISPRDSSDGKNPTAPSESVPTTTAPKDVVPPTITEKPLVNNTNGEPAEEKEAAVLEDSKKAAVNATAAAPSPPPPAPPVPARTVVAPVKPKKAQKLKMAEKAGELGGELDAYTPAVVKPVPPPEPEVCLLENSRKWKL